MPITTGNTPKAIQGAQPMAKLTTKARNKLPTSTFALPGRRYPINDASHARNALARVSQHGSPAEKSRVRAAVHRKFPAIGKKGRAHHNHGGFAYHPPMGV